MLNSHVMFPVEAPAVSRSLRLPCQVHIKIIIQFIRIFQKKYHNSRFECVIGYLSAFNGSKRENEVSEIFPTDGSLVKVYHPVTVMDIIINGKSTIQTGNTTESDTGSSTGNVFDVMNGTRLEIQCKADGYPLPTYQSPQGIGSK